MVERSSTGPEILLRIEPERNDFLVVKLREGMASEIWGLDAFFVVNARERDMVAGFYLPCFRASMFGVEGLR